MKNPKTNAGANRVEFFFSRTGHCEVWIESAKNTYAVRIHHDGVERLHHNGDFVERFPIIGSSPLVGRLVQAVDANKQLILAYMAEADEREKNIIWWRIKENLAEGICR